MGAPTGNKNNSKGRESTKALFQALAIASGMKEEDEVLTRYKVLVKMWQAQIENALDGDKSSLLMITDRTDGKPAQTITGDDGGPLQIIIQGKDAAL